MGISILKIAYRKLKQFMIKIVVCILGKRPLENIIILESHNDFDSNCGAFYEYLLKKELNKQYRIVWFVKNEVPKTLPYNVFAFKQYKISLKKTYNLCSAKFILSGQNIIGRVRKGQIACFTGHGSLGVKNVRGKISIPNGITHYLSPSENIGELMAEQYMIPYPNTRQLVLGFPMHDVFYDKAEGDLHKITSKNYSKVFLWMPTFRKTFGRVDSNHEYKMGIPLVDNRKDFERLNSYLEEKEALLIIKIHPMQDMEQIKIKNLSHIIVLDGIMIKKLKIDNYRLMKDVDALISDYSSAATDFLHADKPIAYSLDDLEDYNIGFIVDDPTTLMAGHLLYDMNDLLHFVSDVISEKDLYAEKRRQLFDYIFKYHDGNSCERLAKFMGIFS